MRKRFKGRRFARHKSADQIRQQCRQQRVEFNDEAYRVYGSDFIRVGSRGKGYALYSVCTGQFFGATPENVSFSSQSTDHEDEPWFQALLEFFYEGEATTPAPLVPA